MTKEDLLKKCGLSKNQLVNTNLGFLDILDVKDDIVSYGFLAKGQIETMGTGEFCSKFKK